MTNRITRRASFHEPGLMKAPIDLRRLIKRGINGVTIPAFSPR
jgi:hypothetical protein